MSKLFWKALLTAPAMGAAFAVSSVAVAAESAPSLNVGVDVEPIQLAQITSVSELSDVSPSDWAFQALQSLVENYGCIQGYPDRTFRGNRSMTRFEFAAGLNACLDVMAALIAQSGIPPEELAAIRRLQEEFRADLATLRGRVDALEAETATLRAQQFSTTTKLRGQVDAHVVSPFNGVILPAVEDSFSVHTRARLNFDSSFTGRDRLRVRLQGASGNPSMAGLGGFANGGGNVANRYDVEVNQFAYRFPIGSRIDMTLSGRGLANDLWTTYTIPFDGASVGDAGRPQFYSSGGSGSNGPGGGMNISFTDSIVLDLGYTSADGPGSAFNPAVGVFNSGSQMLIAQLNFVPDSPFNAAVTYMRNNRSIDFNGGAVGFTNTYAGQLGFDFGRFFTAGHVAFQDFNGGNDFSWTAGLGANDIFLEGSQLGVYGGQLPQTGASTNNPWMVEGYYAIPVNQFITVTPALIAGEANIPGNDSRGIWGVIRGTFNF